MSPSENFEHASLVRPCPGERVSGDTVFVRGREGDLLLAVVDVLGHGPEANSLAREIDAFLADQKEVGVTGLMKDLHERLRGTRGAAIGLCTIDASCGRAVYVGTGNTVLRRFGSTETRLVSLDGIVGQNMRTPLPQDLQLEKGDLLVLYTDGVKDRFNAKDYPGVYHQRPDDVVRVIVERFGKSYDDAACIAVRYVA